MNYLERYMSAGKKHRKRNKKNPPPPQKDLSLPILHQTNGLEHTQNFF